MKKFTKVSGIGAVLMLAKRADGAASAVMSLAHATAHRCNSRLIAGTLEMRPPDGRPTS